MLDGPCNLRETLVELERTHPGVPFLGLGQTVFWDEPLKAGVALALREIGSNRTFLAGVHDTDYFGKHAGSSSTEPYVAVGHNDTTTRDLWSAVGEFSTLLGSETVVTRDMLMAAGVRLRTIARSRPSHLDEATEAWGWKGVVGTNDDPRVAAEVPVNEVFGVLEKTLRWALESTLATVRLEDQETAEAVANRLMALVCGTADEDRQRRVGDYYRHLLPHLYNLTAGKDVPIETTATTDLLRFNTATCNLPRFDLARLFVDPASREIVEDAYNQAIASSELYTLDRFGTGAIPFDLVIPGHGRGTLRLGRRGAVIQTPVPQFLSFPKPLVSLEQVASAVESKFGPNCTLVGKAVTLIGLLSREFLFVFHEGASGYVRRSKAFHRRLAEAGFPLELNPILRVGYRAWDAMDACCSWIRLPGPFRRPFGAEEICSKSFATRWRTVSEEQKRLLDELSALRRPIDLIRFLEYQVGGAWRSLAGEYNNLHERAEAIRNQIESEREARKQLYAHLRTLRAKRVETEREMGRHFRDAIFEKSPTESDMAQRKAFQDAVRETIHEIDKAKAQAEASLRRQNELARSPESLDIHERRRSIELEAELKRLSLAREAIICSEGLEKADHRPSAWWFPLVCPEGRWFRETFRTAVGQLEPLT